MSKSVKITHDTVTDHVGCNEGSSRTIPWAIWGVGSHGHFQQNVNNWWNVHSCFPIVDFDEIAWHRSVHIPMTVPTECFPFHQFKEIHIRMYFYWLSGFGIHCLPKIAWKGIQGACPHTPLHAAEYAVFHDVGCSNVHGEVWEPFAGLGTLGPPHGTQGIPWEVWEPEATPRTRYWAINKGILFLT